MMVKFWKGLKAKYTALTPDSGTLYFVTDAQELYLGSTLIADYTADDIAKLDASFANIGNLVKVSLTEVDGVITSFTVDETALDQKLADDLKASKEYTDQEINKITTGAGYATTKYVDDSIDALDATIDNGDNNLTKVTIVQENGKLISVALDESNLNDKLSTEYKAKQVAINNTDGSTVKTVTGYSQDEQGVVTLTYEDIAFPVDDNTEYHIEYDSANKVIKLVAGADSAKMEINTDDFIKDGMITSVTLVQEDGEGKKGQFLKIEWNDDGNDITYVDVTTLVDVYVGEEGITVTSDYKVKHTNILAAAGSTTASSGAVDYEGSITLPVVNYDKNGHITSVSTTTVTLPKAVDISGKADKVTGATAGNFAGLDVNGNLVDSGKKAADFLALGTSADTAGTESYYGLKGSIDGAHQQIQLIRNGTMTVGKASNADTASSADTAGNAILFGGNSPEHYATAQSVQTIVDTYATKAEAASADELVVHKAGDETITGTKHWLTKTLEEDEVEGNPDLASKVTSIGAGTIFAGNAGGMHGTNISEKGVKIFNGVGIGLSLLGNKITYNDLNNGSRDFTFKKEGGVLETETGAQAKADAAAKAVQGSTEATVADCVKALNTMNNQVANNSAETVALTTDVKNIVDMLTWIEG